MGLTTKPRLASHKINACIINGDDDDVKTVKWNQADEIKPLLGDWGVLPALVSLVKTQDDPISTQMHKL